MNELATSQHAFEIRRCRSEDFEDLLPLFRELWPDKPTNRSALRRIYKQELASKSGAYLCVVKQRRIVGFGSLKIKNSLWLEGSLAHIDELVVKSEYRGKGVGAALLRRLEMLAEHRGCRRVELDSASHRKLAHKFYEDRGFENRAFLFSKPL